MVERIVAAGQAVLEQDGYDALTTNRVAAAAGVSPGSLYQYFPDKGAIVETVIERWSIGIAERVTAALADRLDAVGPDAVHQVLDALVAALEADAAMLRVVFEELPAARNRASRLALERRVRELATAYLSGMFPRVRAWSTASWVLVLAVEQIATRWVIDRPDVGREELVDEMATLVTSYLQAVTSAS